MTPLGSEENIMVHVLSKLDSIVGLDISAKNNTLEHFHYVCCREVEYLIVSIVDHDCQNSIDWFIKYLGMGSGKNNLFNRKISEIYWNKNH